MVKGSFQSLCTEAVSLFVGAWLWPDDNFGVNCFNKSNTLYLVFTLCVAGTLRRGAGRGGGRRHGACTTTPHP